MNKNIKIAKELIKMAKSLTADDENDIEVSCFCDSYIAQQDCENTFNFYGNGFGGKYTLAVDKDIKDSSQVFKVYDVQKLVDSYDYYADYKVQAYEALPFDKIKQIIRNTGNLDEINKKCEEQEFDYTDFESIDEFLEQIERYDGETVVSLLNDEAIDAIVEASKPYLYIPDFDKMSNGDYEGCGLQLKEGYDGFTSTGYSQGDFIEVIYKTSNYNSKTIDHILWDAPVYCRITINGDDYYIDSQLKDNYEYDKDEALEICERIIPDFDKYRDQVEDLLPENPEYIY